MFRGGKEGRPTDLKIEGIVKKTDTLYLLQLASERLILPSRYLQLQRVLWKAMELHWSPSQLSRPGLFDKQASKVI
jgi:hypothetical protein